MYNGVDLEWKSVAQLACNNCPQRKHSTYPHIDDCVCVFKDPWAQLRSLPRRTSVCLCAPLCRANFSLMTSGVRDALKSDTQSTASRCLCFRRVSRAASHRTKGEEGEPAPMKPLITYNNKKIQHPTKRLCATWLMHRAVSPRWKCITRFLVMVCDASPCNGLSTPHIYRGRAVRVPKKNGARRENNHAHLHIYIRCSHTARSSAAALSW